HLFPFMFCNHLFPITTASAAGPVAATGSSDDSIHIYDLPSSSSLGSLHHNTVSITSLSFFTPSPLSFPYNLFFADADGSICIFNADPFAHVKSIHAHNNGVNDLAVHPFGKLALTVGRDECLAMLNLVRKSWSFYCRLGKEANLVMY